MLEIEIVTGDVSDFSCDVLVLKHAQAFYGAEAQVAASLTLGGVDRAKIDPLPDQYVLLSSDGAVAAQQVLFVGTPPLYEFDYSNIRRFAARSLEIISEQLPTASHIAMTIHGVGINLDEREAFTAQLGGIADAQKNGISARRISIIERDFGRAGRLNLVLRQILRPLGSPSTRDLKSVVGQQLLIAAGSRSDSKPHVFVAMPFSKQFEDVYIFGIKGPVNGAGYLCERADMLYFTRDILDRIRSRIETSSLVIADLTEADPRVYLEVGYALGKNRSTLLLAKEGTDLKFDVRGQRCLVYQNIVDLAKQLQSELAAIKIGN
jgi:hypothetical protein